MTPIPQEHTTQEEEISTAPVFDGERIVISGMSGLYLDSNNVSELSEILYNKINRVSENGTRFKFNHPEVVHHSGSVPGLNLFDAQFFKVHYRLATAMDPMARKILEQSYQAIYDAGINPDDLSNKKIGVYIGTSFSEAEKIGFYNANSRTGFGIAGCSKTMFANRISYWLNAKGPSMSIDEACCSSTAALEQAYLAMSRGDCEAAIVGGSYLCLHPQSSVLYGRIINLCQDGKTKSFDENADGCAKSEAINVLFLQKAKDALRIYANVMHVKSEFTCMLPGETGPQYGFYRDIDKSVNFMKKFYEEAKVPAEAIEYVEAVGCAIKEADKVELQAIEKVFCNDREDPLLIGSVMSNVGYNEAASGITAITKVLLGYHTGQIAANLHCTNPRQDVEALREGRMRVVTEHQGFRRSYVAVNGMSVTGVNSHVLLHGNYKPKDPSRYKSNIAHLVNISARHEEAVTHILENLKANPIDPEQLRLLHNIHSNNISGHLGRGFIILDTNEEQKTISLSERVEYFDNARRPLWFVYSGMGSQWAGMGTQLMRIPIFAAAIERCHKALEPKGIDIVDIITSTDEKTFDNILHSFVGIAAIQIGLTDILRELGLKPDGIIGHSVGELGCAYGDGCLTAEEMILSAYSRGLVSLETPFIRGSMAAIGLGYEQILPMCPPEIQVACHNGPESSTISGPADIMRKFVGQLTTKGIFAKEVPCSNIAYHSRYIADAGPKLLEYLSEVIKNPKPRSGRWISTSVPQDRWNEPSAKLCSAEYHTNNLLRPVLFEETSKLIPNDAVLVEIAPHGLLQAILKRSLNPNCKNIALTRRKHPDNTFLLLEGIGKLFMEGYNPKVNVLYPEVELPVSSGTPFLSHLVKWAHAEKWPIPFFRSANRKVAASCDYVTSLQDVEDAYLQGHTLRGHTVYPFSATLMLVWDIFAMTVGVPRKQISVEFRNLHLYTQPIMHDQRQLRLSMCLHRGAGKFEILNEGIKLIIGTIVAFNVDDIKPRRINIEENTKVNIDLTADDVYQLFKDRDYSYSGEFRSIEGANASLTEASLIWRDNWVTFVDGLLQLNMLRQKHDGVSMPTNIENLIINIQEHQEIVNKSFVSDSKVLIKAEVLDYLGVTRCGGVSISNIKLENLPPVVNKDMTLKALKFIPNSQAALDISTSLEVITQIVAENVNKPNLNVIGIVNQAVNGLLFKEVNKAVKNIFGVNVTYDEITREAALKKPNLHDFDLVLVENLSTDDELCQLLHRILQKDQFLISEEDVTFGGRTRPSSLYRVLSVHNISENGQKRSTLQLIRWGPSTAVATTTITVRSASDIPLLVSTRNYLTVGHRLLIIAPYPTIPGLKELVGGWRSEDSRNKIHLIMVAKDSIDSFFVNEIPDIDLAYNVLDNGKWGGEYYVSLEETPTVSKNVTLQCSQIGDYDSLTWVEAPELPKSGVAVKVEYAGINYDDVKKASGSLLYKENLKNAFGMDFSGTTKSGERVMGLVPYGAASSVVHARPELLWPVPAHWTLEDAATVPLAYAHALYCLGIKSRKEVTSDMSVLVHGGTGAFGQAVISIALAYGYEVFTTVSDMRKKHFLRKLFPQLKAEHIGNSRDHSFADMVMIATKGAGCNIVISSLGEDLKASSINCVRSLGTFIDTSQLHNHDVFSYGLYSLTRDRAYAAVDISSIYDPANIEHTKFVQRMLSEGITRGYVRPLSRVTYAPEDAPSAFRLVAASRHRGRVLLKVGESTLQAQPRITCSPDRTHLILCNDDTFGLQISDKLVERGAKKIFVHYQKHSSYLQIKIRSWQESGVEVVVSNDDLKKENDFIVLLNKAKAVGPVEGVYVTVGDKQLVFDDTFLSILDQASRKLCPEIKYFAVLSTGDNSIGKEVCLHRAKDNLPATIVSLPELTNDVTEGAWYRGATEAMERALRGSHNVVQATTAPAQQVSLLQKIAAIAGVTIDENLDKQKTLAELGVMNESLLRISMYFRIHYSVIFEDRELLALTVNALKQFEKAITKPKFKDEKGLAAFFSNVDSDELLATTDFVLLPTLVNDAAMRDDEFDSSQTYLCIIPGMEGHYGRFRVLCERLKLPALVLQPGLDLSHETIQETAQRLAAVMLKKMGLRNNFYLLGYESGMLVALEMAAILEDNGLTGTVYCLGFAPDEFVQRLEDQLAEYKTEEQLQDAVARHMYSIMTGGDSTSVDEALQAATTWPQKVDACVRNLLGRVSHSAQYARALIESALRRIEATRHYVPRVHALRSQIVLMRAASSHPAPSPAALQRHSQRPVIVHQLNAPLAHAATDLNCAVVVNIYLDSTIHEIFEKKNLCNTYLINAEVFIGVD
ncbi:unnamed protein product [Spodoptera littoralis]|uniref:Uncharacterized protein n=1 Tax=Spodoptera littoralis TaxID=7109 RepID=A0A9P0I9K2_SPOLI|nr:unnamed protein product [Spodoptera littoralis]CAH1641260.1 unnamed protein product [Spodoptera littoralis]